MFFNLQFDGNTPGIGGNSAPPAAIPPRVVAHYAVVAFNRGKGSLP